MEREVGVCKACGYSGRVPMVLEGPFGPHWGKVVCYNCQAFIEWAQKPDQDKAKRPARHRNLVAKYGRGFCELCLRKEESFAAGNHLVGHHVIEYRDSPDSSRENVWILCKGCERLVHWRRTYLEGQKETG